MSGAYTEIPENYSIIEPFLITELKDIRNEIHASGHIFFYDTCSFRKHANLNENGRTKIMEYLKRQASAVVITRIILMELASDSGIVNGEYIVYLRDLHDSGIRVLLLNEENIYEIMSECFSSNYRVNEYLMWAVRMIPSPVSTIKETLDADAKLSEALRKGKNLSTSGLYRRFFMQVRSNKERDDDLGEELIGICTYILAYLPGFSDGKICIFTEDKGAAGKLGAMYHRTRPGYRGSRIALLSTPKLVQTMYREGMELTEEDMISILSQGTSGNIAVMGTTPYDLDVDGKISMTCEDLARKIREPNGINIVF